MKLTYTKCGHDLVVQSLCPEAEGFFMTLFELVKQNICVPDAAEHYWAASQPKQDVQVSVT